MGEDKKPKREELIIEAKSFFDSYKKELGDSIRKGGNVIYLDFMKLTEFSNRLAEEILKNPEDTLRLVELAIEESGLVSNVRVRLANLPKSQDTKIRNIRSKHLDEMIVIEGIIRQASDVRPQVVNAKFECPSCGTIISVLQMEKKFREPSRCSCGRRGGFKLISKEMVDTQRLVIEESPESLSGGEQPKRINVFVKEDLVEPRMEEKTTPGSRVKVIGILKEVPVPLPSGGLSTRFELSIEVNNIIALEETFEELDITEEDERQILELSQDPEIFNNLAKSITPSVWGYEEIKRALVLQLFAGVQKVHTDGQKSRGDIHILLIGDPGVAKSIGKNEEIMYISKKETGYISVEKLYNKFGRKPTNLKVLTINMKEHKPEWKKVNEILKHSPKEKLIEIITEHGKKITATKDHSFITLSEKGEIIPIKGSNINKGTYLPIPINYHKEIFKVFTPGELNKKNTNSKLLPEKIPLDENLGFFFGIFLAEGYIKNKRTIEISNKNKEIQKKVIDSAKRLRLNYNADEKSVSVFSINLGRILGSYCYDKDISVIKGFKGNYSRIKKIPEWMYFAPCEFVYGLLSGLFSGDGRLIKDKKMLKGFELTTISKKLAKGTSDLLFSIGILNKIKKREYNYKKRKTSCYYVSIPTPMIKKFSNNIKIFGREVKFNEKDPIYSYNNMIPCGWLVYEIVKKLGYNSRKNGNRTLASEMRTIKKRGEIGRLRLLKLIKEFEKKNRNLRELKLLKKITESNIIWSKVKEIKECGKEKEVYDLSIPSTNTFVANGIGVHNSVTLDFMAKISPKGRYVVGKSASGAGLTATVVRDEYLRGWSLEAGAMVLSNKGLVCIDELEKMDPGDRSAMHEAMEQQCMLPDFKLMLANGSEVKIGELVDNLIEKNKSKIYQGKDCEILEVKNIRLLSTDFLSVFPTNATRISRHLAPKKFIKIILTNGQEITVTPEHPCWIVKEGKIKTIPAEKLKEGIQFPIPSKIVIESQPYNSKNDLLCKILGYHISDGSYELNRSKKTGIQFWNNDEELIKEYKNVITKYFNINPIITKRNNQFAVRVISKKVVEEFEKLDKNLLEKGDIKKIPEKIMSLPIENLRYLLRALYDGDGSVIFQKRNGCRISFVSQNRKLTKQIANLLLRFEIQSSIFRDNHSKVWRLDISGQDNLTRFLAQISFLSKKKKERLKRYCSLNKSYKTIKDIIPGCTEKINEIFKKLDISAKREIGHSIDLGVEKQRKFLQKLVLIAEKRLKKIELIKENQYKEIKSDLDEIKKLAFGYARWTKIKEVKEIENKGIKWVYDVTIEPNHTFISNGMILHNTVTISKANVQACYSSDTEVLTEKGWQKYDNVKNLKIAQYNPTNNSIKFLPHKGLYVYNYNGKMYNFKNKRADILVTPNHTMLVKLENQKKYKKINAEDITSYRIKVLNSGNFIGAEQKYFILPAIKHKQKRKHTKYTHQHKNKKIPMNLWLEFLGYYLTEGGIETIPTIGIVQKRGKDCEKIQKCLVKLTKILGCSLSEINCGKYVRFKITQTQLYEYLKRLGHKCWDKNTSINFSEFSKKQLKIFYDAMMLGDGSSIGKDFGSTSEKFIDDMQTISCLIGKSACKNIQYKEGTRGKRKTMYRISLCEKQEIELKKKSIKKINYNEKVWCFSTSTGFFITRRNGKIAIQGNTLRAETSVLAAANPKFGRFDPYQSIAQQIDIPPTLINRFDIIFTLRDIPDKEKDRRIASHVLSEHLRKGEEMLIPRELFRKYVAFAKQKIRPELSNEAVEEIKTFYVELRNKPVASESALKPIPISARQLQALIRMSEASAKIRLSKVVSIDDAKIAIELMKYYLMQVGYDYESKTFDIDKISGRMSSSKRNKVFMVRDIITELEGKVGKLIPIEEIKKELEDKLSEDEIDDAIRELEKNSIIFKPRRGYIEKM